MATVIEDLGDFLASKGMGIVADTILLNKMNDSPDNLISITLVGGDPLDIHIRTARPSFNVQVRNKSHLEAIKNINTIAELFSNDFKRSIEISDNDPVTPKIIRKVIFRKILSPIFLKEDDQGRAYYSMSVSVITHRDY